MMKKTVFTSSLLLLAATVSAQGPSGAQPSDADIATDILSKGFEMMRFLPLAGMCFSLLVVALVVALIVLIKVHNNRNKKNLYILAGQYLEQGKEMPLELLPSYSKTKKTKTQNKLLIGLLSAGLSVAILTIGVVYGFDRFTLLLGVMFLLVGASYLIVWRYEKPKSEKPKGE